MLLRHLLIALILPAFSAAYADPDEAVVIPHRQDRPPNRPYSPEEAMARMVVPEGFVVELVAAEPQIVNPLAMAFDDRGRIWVTESLEYPRADGGPGRDRVKILEDTDGDGSADQVTVFARGLNIPSGLAIGHGGVWVVNAPDLLFFPLREGQREGRAAKREVIVTGFGRTDRHELPNSLTWGPDGWLYGLNGVFNRSRVVSNGREFRFTCALFRVHPRTREFQIVCEGTSNPWGLVWDPEGSAIVSACHWAKDHLFHFVETGIYQRQAGPYPDHAWPLGSVSDHGHQKTAYCGLAYLEGDAYPEEYRGRLYMGNIHGGCINVDVLERDGSTYVSHAAPDFLTANDVWFMPVSQKVGPDGCLYILDWYDRYHCYQDAGRDPEGIDRERGRLYRVRYRGTPRAPLFDLAAASDDALIERLQSPKSYYREHAQRILVERGTASARLEKLVTDPSVPRRARLHALWTLLGQERIEAGLLDDLLAHPDATFRAWAVRAAGELESVPATVRQRVAAHAFDAAPEVGLQVAIASRKIQGLDPLALLVGVLSSCGEDRLVPHIAWQNLHPLLETRGGEFTRLAASADLERAPALARLLPRAAGRLVAASTSDVAAAGEVLGLLLRADPVLARECISVVASRLASLSPEAVEALASRVRYSLERAMESEVDDALVLPARLLAARLGIATIDPGATRAVFLASDREPSVRLQALDALIVARDDRILGAVGRVLADAPPAVAAGVLAALSRLESRLVAEVVLARYEGLATEVKPLAIDLLLERRRWTRAALDAVLAERLPRAALDASHLRRILAGNDRESIWAVEKHWGKVRTERDPERERVVTESLRSLAERSGDPLKGREVFRAQCSRCHTIWGEGADVGPDLTTNGRGSFEQLVASVLDPSLVVGPGYETTTIMTTDGRVLTGLLVEDSDRVALKLPGGRRETLPRAQVKHVHSSPLSMMPEGLETVLTPRELVDLFAFLGLDAPPEERPRAIPGAPAWLREWAAAR